MRIAIASDHAGFKLKQELKSHLEKAGHNVIDFGAHSDEKSDYPDFAMPASESVNSGKNELGVLVCGSGIGMCIAANRFLNVRAVVLHNEFEAKMSRQHNNANIACFGGRTIDADSAVKLLDIFLKTSFEGGRHAPRVAKLARIL